MPRILKMHKVITYPLLQSGKIRGFICLVASYQRNLNSENITLDVPKELIAETVQKEGDLEKLLAKIPFYKLPPYPHEIKIQGIKEAPHEFRLAITFTVDRSALEWWIKENGRYVKWGW